MYGYKQTGERVEGDIMTSVCLAIYAKIYICGLVFCAFGFVLRVSRYPLTHSSSSWPRRLCASLILSLASNSGGIMA